MPEEWNWLGKRALALNEMQQAALELLEQGSGLMIWLLHGEMGSGKTTLVKRIVKELGVESLVTSPTFSIVNEYGQQDKPVVYHFDLYRIKNEAEALDIGFEEYMTSGNLCLIEWPEKIKTLLPDQYFEVKIQYHDLVSRDIYFRRHE